MSLKHLKSQSRNLEPPLPIIAFHIVAQGFVGQPFSKQLYYFERSTLPTTFPKISKYSPKIVRMRHERFTNKFNCILRVKYDIGEVIDISTSEDMESTLPVSRMWLRTKFTSGVFSIIIYRPPYIHTDRQTHRQTDRQTYILYLV